MRELKSLARYAGSCGLGLATMWSTTAAFAACGAAQVGGGGSGPPSISVAEASTTQVLEQIRKRTEAAQQPMTVASVAEGGVVEGAASSQAAAASSSASTAAAQTASGGGGGGGGGGAGGGGGGGGGGSSSAPASKPVAPQKTASNNNYSSGGGSLKDDGLSQVSHYSGGYVRTNAVWGQGFADYERHKNIAPDSSENATRRAYTGGGMVGADWTISKQSATPEALQFGVFTGYSSTQSNFSDTSFRATTIDGDARVYVRGDNEQDVDGPFIGAYLAHASGQWSSDLIMKYDFFDLSQSSSIVQFDPSCGVNGVATVTDTGRQFGDSTVDTFTVAANTAYRHDLAPGKWFAPTIGLRYSRTEFGNDASTTVFQNGGLSPTGRLGLEDGYSLRLQAGARYGIELTTAQGYFWTSTVGAFLYSDVIVDGFTFTGGPAAQTVGPVDEGELRGLVQFASKLDVGNGVSYLFVAEARGGDDLFGVGGQIGMRYEW